MKIWEGIWAVSLFEIRTQINNDILIMGNSFDIYTLFLHLYFESCTEGLSVCTINEKEKKMIENPRDWVFFHVKYPAFITVIGYPETADVSIESLVDNAKKGGRWVNNDEELVKHLRQVFNEHRINMKLWGKPQFRFFIVHHKKKKLIL